MLPSTEATRIAREFMQNYTDLPGTSFPMPRQYVQSGGYRIFEASYADMTLHKTFPLLVFHVKDNGDVELKYDHREEVRAQLEKLGGQLPGPDDLPVSPVVRLQRIVEAPAAYPDWLVKMEMAEDEPSCDATATLRIADGSTIVIRIAAFRDREEKSVFMRFHEQDNDIIGIVFPFNMKDDGIRTKLMEKLERMCRAGLSSTTPGSTPRGGQDLGTIAGRTN